MEDSKKSSSIPTWDGTEKTCGRYLAKIEAQAQYFETADALDEVEVRQNCPNKSVFDAIDPATTDVRQMKQRR